MWGNNCQAPELLCTCPALMAPKSGKSALRTAILLAHHNCFLSVGSMQAASLLLRPLHPDCSGNSRMCKWPAVGGLMHAVQCYLPSLALGSGAKQLCLTSNE